MFRRKSAGAAASHGGEFPPQPPDAPTLGILDQYVRGLPSAQHALDLFKDSWSSALPPTLGLQAGPLPTFADDRIQMVLAHLNSIKSYKVLELGPLEAGHTYMLHEAGATKVVAVEGSSRAFLKCLVVKEILGLNRAHFLLGDFNPYLQTTTERFDLVVASGVVYHAMDPLALLESIARVTDKVAIWTHYWDETPIKADPRIERMFIDEPDVQEWRGHQITLHPRHYLEALEWSGFCGGPETAARWLERADLLMILGELGFGTVTVLNEDPHHVNGPSLLLVAER